MGMGFMALLIVGSCTMLTYKAVDVAEDAAATGGDAITRLEEAADRQAEKRKNDEFYREAATADTTSDYYE
jgi:hypothetical protein